MADITILDLTTENVGRYGVCGYKNEKREGFAEKTAWLRARADEGLRVKIVVTPADGAQGMIEYMPGPAAWRPMLAPEYMVIHCLFVGFKKQYKNRGLAGRLIAACLDDARAAGMAGAAVVARDGAFMVGPAIFLRHGFAVVDTAPPDFSLLALRFNPAAPPPRFSGAWAERQAEYPAGLTILRTDQCPYSVKNVREMSAVAQEEFGLTPRVITLADAAAVHRAPCPFGTFAVLHDGRLLADHPISATRLRNILQKILR